jgi:hypothetical protein
MITQFEREFGGDVVGRGDAGSPGSDGASPYQELRRPHDMRAYWPKTENA